VLLYQIRCASRYIYHLFVAANRLFPSVVSLSITVHLSPLSAASSRFPAKISRYPHGVWSSLQRLCLQEYVGCLARFQPYANGYKTGAQALKGKEEFIEGIIFEGVDHARNIRGKGKLIQIYDPSKDSPAYWEHEDEHRYASHAVPAGYKVRVVAATVQFI
jgi:hypothetical protein